VDAEDADWSFDGEPVSLLVVGEILRRMLGVGVLLAGLGWHEAAGESGTGGRREQMKGVPGVLPSPPAVLWASRMAKSRPWRRRWCPAASPD
jgi:hypothetical protein